MERFVVQWALALEMDMQTWVQILDETDFPVT